MYSARRPFDAPCRDIRIDEIVGQTERDSQYQKDATYEQAALGHDSKDLSAQFEIAIDEYFGYESIQSG
jgi:hypothetical protein